MDDLTSTVGTRRAGAAGVAVLALALALSLTMRVRRLRAAQKTVLGEGGERDLVGHADLLARELAALSDRAEAADARLDARLTTAERRLDGAIAHAAVVRYDALDEMSGRQSSSVALLDAHRNGVVLSSILQRDTARLYAKPVLDGRSELTLSPEEETAVARALASPRAEIVRVAYLGPPGTFNDDALRAAAAGAQLEPIASATVRDAIVAVEDGDAERALVPYENSIEGSVRTTLDTLVLEAESVTIVGEHDHPIRHSLIARDAAAAPGDPGRPLPSPGARPVRAVHPRAALGGGGALRPEHRRRGAPGRRLGRALGGDRRGLGGAAVRRRGARRRHRGRPRQRHAVRLDRPAGDAGGR